MKNRILLKAAALALTLCLSAPQFLSCQSGPLLKLQTQAPSEQTSDKTPVSEQSPAPGEEEGQLPKPQIGERFDGAVIRFAVCNDYRGLGSRSIDLEKDDDPVNTVNVQIIKRNAQVEKEPGVKIKLEKAVSTQVMVPEMTPILASGLYVYDVQGLNRYFDAGADKSGHLYRFCIRMV